MSKLQLKTQNYLSIIGVETHVELKTKSKMFCGCSTKHFLVKPNTHTCPVCLGLPGVLPVPNKKAIELCIMLGLVLGCKVNKESKFDRKNYFYPDLPKGYQISQYDSPFCKNGKIGIRNKELGISEKSIRINRVHMEEDTAKLIHTKVNGKNCALIDFNRSGVPLMEVVSEPDINSSEEAILYLKKLQQIIRYLNISDADMEKGSMRCEANISLARQPAASSQQPAGRKTGNWQLATGSLPNYKVEVKNINSFRFVKKAIEYEIERQKQILESGEVPEQETRGYDEKKGKTFTQRGKEEAHDYRYFPEPDIPPIRLEIKEIKKLRNLLPELPDKKMERFIKQYGISEYYAEILTRDTKTADAFEKVVKMRVEQDLPILKLASAIVNKRVDVKKDSPLEIARKIISQTQDQITDEKEIEKVVKEVLKENPKAVKDYKKGKKQVIGFLIGQVMRETKGKADPAVIQEKIKLLITNY